MVLKVFQTYTEKAYVQILLKDRYPEPSGLEAVQCTFYYLYGVDVLPTFRSFDLSQTEVTIFWDCCYWREQWRLSLDLLNKYITSVLPRETSYL